MANNKVKGTIFERRICAKLAEDGFWVHFITPDARGAQPFDIIAVKNGVAIAADCKTCESHIFRLSRAEDNQRLAFHKWKACGNSEPLFFVEHAGKVYCIEYAEMEFYEKVDLDMRRPWCILE